MTRKTGKKTKRINRTPQELLEAAYEKSGHRDEPEESGPAPGQPWRERLGLPSDEPEPVPVLIPAPVESSAVMAPLLLTVAEVCALLSVSRSTFFRLKKAGEIPGCVSLGGQVRYRREDLEQWVKQMQVLT